ncbi:MAG: apolipoprotein N-acyltransferase, partial [Desulfovibrio sp.]|nr:apolipoprotein N-acyltransferase [Desulfovibrio sp.]
LPITQVGGLPLPLAIPCVILLNAYLAVFTALTCLAMRRALIFFSSGSSEKPGQRPSFVPALAGGAAWAGFEVLGGLLFTGFPWLVLSAAFVPWPEWIQAACLTGGYGLSGLYAAGACLLAAAFPLRGRSLFLAGGVLLCLAPPLYGAVRLKNLPPTALSRPFGVLMVQGNIDQNQKWIPAFQQAAVRTYMNLTEQGLSRAGREGFEAIDLVLWPETAMPFYFQPSGADVLSDVLRRFVLRRGIHLAFGTLGSGISDGGGPVLFNRVQFLSPAGLNLGTYDKEHLVPFGEYLPLAADFQFLRRILQGMDFSPGRNAALVTLFPDGVRPLPGAADATPASNGVALGMLICYEVIFPELARQRVADGAHVLVTVSNDAWFGATPAPRQHLHLAAMRAVELRRPLVRATNTGYTAVVDAFGRIDKESRLFTETAVAAWVRPSGEITLFYLLHPFLRIFLAAAALLLLFLPRFRPGGRIFTHL